MEIRTLTEQDLPNVSAALEKAWENARTHKPWVAQNWNRQKSHPDFYARHIFELSYATKVVVDEAYLVVYTAGPDWFDPCRLNLAIILMLRLGKGSNFDNLCDAFEHLREKEECDHIQLGTALSPSDRAMIKRLTARGYTVFETILTK